MYKIHLLRKTSGFRDSWQAVFKPTGKAMMVVNHVYCAQANLTKQRLEQAICHNLNHEALFSLNKSEPVGHRYENL